MRHYYIMHCNRPSAGTLCYWACDEGLGVSLPCLPSLDSIFNNFWKVSIWKNRQVFNVLYIRPARSSTLSIRFKPGKKRCIAGGMRSAGVLPRVSLGLILGASCCSQPSITGAPGLWQRCSAGVARPPGHATCAWPRSCGWTQTGPPSPRPPLRPRPRPSLPNDVCVLVFSDQVNVTRNGRLRMKRWKKKETFFLSFLVPAAIESCGISPFLLLWFFTLFCLGWKVYRLETVCQMYFQHWSPQGVRQGLLQWLLFHAFSFCKYVINQWPTLDFNRRWFYSALLFQ